jgi:hypothetical protein
LLSPETEIEPLEVVNVGGPMLADGRRPVTSAVRLTCEIVSCDTAPEFAPTCRIPALLFVAVGACHANAVTEEAFGPKIEKSPVVSVGTVVFG